jgi:hypothetical protein
MTLDSLYDTGQSTSLLNFVDYEVHLSNILRFQIISQCCPMKPEGDFISVEEFDSIIMR